MGNPNGAAARTFRDQLKPEGRVEIFVTKGPRPALTLWDPIPCLLGMPQVWRGHDLSFVGCDVVATQDVKNILVNIGKDQVLNSLTTGFVHPIARMAIGDRGTIPSDSTVPKVAQPTQTALFNEIYRADVDATVLNIGTPTVHQVKFIKTFSALLIPLTSFSNQANPVVNEVGLVAADLLAGAPLPRASVPAPAAADDDERLFSIRTFKSVPFQAADEISVTIRYTVFIE